MRTLWKVAFLLTAILFLAKSAQASWHYNENGGFGAYEPEGWHSEINGRRSELFGPDESGKRTLILIGSDWVSRIDGLTALQQYVAKEEAQEPRPAMVSGLSGFQVGDTRTGKIYLYRDRNNVIVIDFELRGSQAQLDEADQVMSSIEVRTKGIEYP